jgi:PAS domain S-box-containing protein
MDREYRRQVELNEWIVTTRWFYMVAVFLIGILGNTLSTIFEIKFSFFSIAFLLLIYLFINAYFYKLIDDMKRHKSERRLKFVGIGQIAIELIIFTIIMRLIGEESLASVFFFLPIISASIIFGIRGAVITALLSGVIVNFSTIYANLDSVLEYMVKRGDVETIDILTLQRATFSMISVIITSNFYLVLALVSGWSFKLIFKREQTLMASVELLTEEKEKNNEEVERLDKSAQQLAEQDRKLKSINIELNKRLNQLKSSEKSIIRAFSDLQTARKRIEEERNKTNAIISNFVDPIIVLDNAGKINLINPAAREIFGFKDDDLGAEISADNNFSMNNFKKIIDIAYEVKTSKELKTKNEKEEEVLITVAGQELTYKVITAQVLDSSKGKLGDMKIFYNLTREKMIDKMKSEFISIAAHQLRTPLSAIKWVIKMVLDGDVGKLNEEQKEFLKKGYDSNERIIGLVNDMLNVSRIEEGRFGYTFNKENFYDLIDGINKHVSNAMESRSIKFELDIPKKLPNVYMDKTKMDLALTNLVENAIKYTPEYGKILLKVELGEKFIKVRVKDNGVGIPKKDQPKLFSKFFRAENVIRMQTEGSGLGLFMVRNIIKRHGGEITFESKEGQGTEFVFTLPINEE